MITWEEAKVDKQDMIHRVVNLLNKYNHTATENGVGVMLDTFWANKNDIIEKMVTHPDYNGNLQIVFTEPFDRDVNPIETRRFVENLLNALGARCKITNEKDENGFTKNEAIRTQTRDLPKTIKTTDILSLTMKPIESLNEFVYDSIIDSWITRASREKFNTTVILVNFFKYYIQPTLNESIVSEIKNACPAINVSSGMKTSKALWRILTWAGLNGKEEQSVFTPYGDMINPLRRDLTFVLSVNPIDYLKMSFGNTWASCHTIDKRNTRGMNDHYSGAYCGGTISYMLDGTSMISYAITETDKANPENYDKVYRNMFHWDGSGTLVQGRVYPQAKDGATDLYKKIRLIVQRVISMMLDVPHISEGNGNDTWVKPNNAREMDFIESRGAHYRDYNNYEDCNVSKMRNKDRATHMVIGHDTICPNCGNEHRRGSEYIVCGNCN